MSMLREDDMIAAGPKGANSRGLTHCRFCAAPLELTMVDLGKSPLCESFLPADRVEAMEPFYPLHVRVCTECWLAQLPSFVPPDEIFPSTPTSRPTPTPGSSTRAPTRT